MFYIIDETGKLVRTATSVPDKYAVESAGYTVVESDLEVDIESIEIHGFPERPFAVQSQVTPLPRVVLTTTAEDLDGDGVPELTADGKTKAIVRIFLRDSKQGLVKKSVEVTLQSSAGSLSQRTVITNEGKASVQFVAGSETVNTVIRASSEGFDEGFLQFELIPKEIQET